MNPSGELLVRLSEFGGEGDAASIFARAQDRARRLRRRRRLAVGTVVVVVAGAAVLWLARPATTPQTIHTTPPPVTPATVVSADDLSSVVSQPTAITVTDGHVWVTGYAPNNGPATLLDFDAATRTLVGRVALADNNPFAMAANTTGVWLRTQQGEQSTSLVEVDPRTHVVTLTLPLHNDGGLAVTETDVWVVDGSQLLDIDPTSGSTKLTVPLPGGGYGPLFVTAGPLGVWLSSPYDNTVWKVDPATGTASVFTTLTGHVSHIVQTNDHLWVTTGDQLVGLDPTDPNARTTIDLAGVGELVTRGTTLWAATGRTLYRINTPDLSPKPLTSPSPSTEAQFVAVDDQTGDAWTTTLLPSAIQRAG